ncbi:MAG: hypothetical protein QGI45_16725, partial [Myxococcota bacterium]|nr:hypothetical protein [Myxococcota bacterium]
QVDSGTLVDLWQHGEKGCSTLPGNIADCSGYAPEATNSNYFCRQVNISTIASPPNVLTIKAVDAFNNESTLSWPVTVDVTGPVITLDSLDISTSGDNAGELTIQSTLVDEGHSVSSANFVIFDTVCNEAEGTTCQQSWVLPLVNTTDDIWIMDESDEGVPFFTSVLAISGSVAFEIQATDSEGNNSSVQGAFPVDNEGPILTVMSPVAESYLNGIIDVKLSVLDTAGIDSVTVRFSDNAGGADPGAGPDCIIPPTQTGICGDDDDDDDDDGDCLEYQTCEYSTCDEASDCIVSCTDSAECDGGTCTNGACDNPACTLNCTTDDNCADGGICALTCGTADDCADGATCIDGVCSEGLCDLGECQAADKSCSPAEEPCAMVFFGGSTYGLQGGYDLSSKLSASTDLTVVTFEATDSLGNTTAVLSQVNLDKSGPEINITYPSAYDLVQGPIIVEATVTEQSCISMENDAVTLLVAGGNAPVNSILVNELAMSTYAYDCTSRDYFIEVDTNDLVGMVFPTLNVTAKDIYGNVSQTGHAFALDNTGPLPSLDEHYVRVQQYTSTLSTEGVCVTRADCAFPAYQACKLDDCTLDDDCNGTDPALTCEKDCANDAACGEGGTCDLACDPANGNADCGAGGTCDAGTCDIGTCDIGMCSGGGSCEMCVDGDSGCQVVTAQGVTECSKPFNPLGDSAVRHGDFFKGLDDGTDEDETQGPERNFAGTFVVRSRVQDRGNEVGDIATAYMQAGLLETSVKLYMLRVLDNDGVAIPKHDGSGDIALLKNQYDHSLKSCADDGDC